MLNEQDIQAAAQRAAKTASVWLFGSYARGEAGYFSDMDPPLPFASSPIRS